MRALALALAVSLSVPLPALACINGMNSHQRPGSQVDLLVRSAGQKADAADWSGALADAEKALSTPDGREHQRRQARRVAALAQLRLGRFKEARSTYQQCLDEAADRSEPSLLVRRAEAEVGLGELAAATPVLEDLAKKDLLPDADAWVALARARLSGKNVEGAKQAVRAALKQQPNHAGAKALAAELDKPEAPAAAGKSPASRS